MAKKLLTSRLNLRVKDKKLTAEDNSSISITDINGIQHSTSGKFIHIIIPHNNTGDFNHMFINAETSVEDHLLDRTAWRMVDRF